MTAYRRIDRSEKAEGKRYFFIRVAPGGEPRYDYHRHVSERFFAAFTDNIGKWCGSSTNAA